MRHLHIQGFTDLLNELPGKECWSITGGPSTGSMINLALGQKIKRKQPLKGQFLSEDEKLHQGEYSIYIEFCSWRLEKKDIILCNSNDDPSSNGNMFKELSQLIRKKITKINFVEPFLDLNVFFSDDLTLRIFSLAGLEESSDNYSIFHESIAHIVGPNGNLRVE
jgi:hypothetical protein